MSRLLWWMDNISDGIIAVTTFVAELIVSVAFLAVIAVVAARIAISVYDYLF